MTKRIIEISSDAAYLKLKHRQLIITRDKTEVGSIPIEDISALILDHPQITITNVCLRELISIGVMVITSDDKHQPIGLFLPLDSHTTQTERINAQANLAKPVKKSLWKQVTQAKVRLQGKVLKEITNNDAGLAKLALKVRSGDPDNIEAQAARRYWTRIFSDKDFKRDREANDQNRFLNYGYAIIRSLVARSLCATGLHPSLGIHHKNKYNSYCLADDLMEPYRPLVDKEVWRISEIYSAEAEMTADIRQELLEIIKREVTINHQTYTMQGAIQKSAQSLSNIIAGNGKLLALPSSG